MYLELKGFIDDKLVKEILSKDHIVKDATFKTRVNYANSDGCGGFDTDTVKKGTESMTREVAIPKSTPNLKITMDNFGDYQSGKVFEELFLNKLVEIVINSMK